ncbi:hypothetical protein AVEN_85214-1 [Araneus ventricosus]|uniref:Uncharacterized protein n=1 Tax=Araneus ventricosus TaxID=182803 RepID=A0A4Y2EEW3_ARAVE|nr:hypothetical protein AVEN_85214-1 [Araneus ventricosus]
MQDQFLLVRYVVDNSLAVEIRRCSEERRWRLDFISVMRTENSNQCCKSPTSVSAPEIDFVIAVQRLMGLYSEQGVFKGAAMDQLFDRVKVIIKPVIPHKLQATSAVIEY